ncbi:MAG TPA: hypothetical protein VME66_06700 [Candidatus Acidoferrales bacterium]|nr:hypothetical protein [Candidatus Acidoferrales bacterium]
MISRRTSLLALGFSVAVSLSVAACGPQSSPTPGNCNPPNGVQTVLVYPAPGATGIPDNFGEVIFASTGTGLSASDQAFLVDNSTSGEQEYAFATVTAWSSPLPSPAATPPFANAVYQSSASTVAEFPEGHNFTVVLNNANSNCFAGTSYGSFTLQ